jgi:hypothetical protein
MFAPLGISGRHLPLKIAAPAKQRSAHHWKFSKVHTLSATCTQLSTFRMYTIIAKFCRQRAEVIQNYENEHVRGMGQGEARQKI